MRRIFFLLPDKTICSAVVEDLEAIGVAESHLHVIASLAQSLDGLPEANVWQKTELAHGIEWGLGLGGIAGLLGGILAVTFPPAGLVLGGGALMAGTAAGAGLGAVVTALLASHEHNHDIDEFARAIERGELLLMVDIPKQQVGEIQRTIKRHFPEAVIGVSKMDKK